MSFQARSVNYPHCSWASVLGSLPVLIHILSPITDNCPSCIGKRERMAVEIISWPISTKEFCRTWVSNSRPSAYQADAHRTPLSQILGWQYIKRGRAKVVYHDKRNANGYTLSKKLNHYLLRRHYTIRTDQSSLYYIGWVNSGNLIEWQVHIDKLI